MCSNELGDLLDESDSGEAYTGPEVNVNWEREALYNRRIRNAKVSDCTVVRRCSVLLCRRRLTALPFARRRCATNCSLPSAVRFLLLLFLFLFFLFLLHLTLYIYVGAFMAADDEYTPTDATSTAKPVKKSKLARKKNVPTAASLKRAKGLFVTSNCCVVLFC